MNFCLYPVTPKFLLRNAAQKHIHASRSGPFVMSQRAYCRLTPEITLNCVTQTWRHNDGMSGCWQRPSIRSDLRTWLINAARPQRRPSIINAASLGELKINYLKFPCLSAAQKPGEAARARLSAQDAALDWSSGQKTTAPSKRGAMKECLGAVWRRRAEDLSKRISDFTSQSAEHLHLRLSLIKPGESLSFTSPPNSLSAAAAFYGRTDEHPFFSFFSFFFHPSHGAPASLLEGPGFFISGKRAGKDREDEWHQWPADTSRDVWLRQMSLVTLVGIPNPDAPKIQQQIEPKLEAPNLSTDHQSHGAAAKSSQSD